MLIEDDQVLAEFAVEANQHLANVERQLSAIDTSSQQINVDAIDELVRGIHAIKGTAGFLGLKTVNVGNCAQLQRHSLPFCQLSTRSRH